MLYSKAKSVEDRVIETLLTSPKTVREIHTSVEKGAGVTERAVYKAVTKLIVAGVLVKAGRRVIVDHEWAKRVSENLGSTAGGMELSQGERASYTFTSMEHLDSFWKTTVLPLERSSGVREIFFYNPHNFWAYLPARKESEDTYYRHFLDSKQYGFFTIGGEFVADKEFKRSYQHDQLQIDLKHFDLFRNTDHVTIIGPFIITVRLGKAVAERIDRLYSLNQGIEVILPDIEKICEKPGKMRFLVENNPTKAAKLKKMLSRNFYIQQATKIPLV